MRIGGNSLVSETDGPQSVSSHGLDDSVDECLAVRVLEGNPGTILTHDLATPEKRQKKLAKLH